MPLRILLLPLVASFVALRVTAQPSLVQTVERAIAIPTVNSYVQTSLYVDPVEADVLTGRWKRPVAGSSLAVLGDTVRWEEIEADSAGWFQHRALRGGWVYAQVHSDSDQIVLLETLGNKFAYVNGEPRIGNRYQAKDAFEDWEPRFDFHLLPIALQKGANDLLLRCNRGRLKVNLYTPEHRVALNIKDLTVPDVRPGENEEMWGAVVVINAQEGQGDGLVIESRLGEEPPVRTTVASIPPLSVFKAPFRFRANGWGKHEGEDLLALRVLDSRGHVLHEASVPLMVRSGAGLHRRTYRSDVDGSIQYYAVQPATKNGPQALVLSVHGANVEAWNQASSYAPKSWAHIVAPTNRRAYGYNWEDWGRKDAIDVLDRAENELDVDTERIYLTGHSMGGHGTWILGSTYPDRFAAIAPSAGYLRVGAYYHRAFGNRGLRNPALIDRALNVTLTDSLLINLKGLGVYVLHGGADEVVRPDEAHRALDILRSFHHDFRYHEEPGVGHWWDRSDEPGTDAVDWLPLFDFFAGRARPMVHRIRSLDFRTAHPGVSASHHWVTIYDQERMLAFSRVRIRLDPGRNRIAGSTENVTMLAIDPGILSKERPAIFRIDSDSLTFDWAVHSVEDRIYLEHSDGFWHFSPKPEPARKGPHRYGTFKSAIDHEVVFVVGTGGTRDENVWAFAKARFDAETFWYQGNGRVEVIADQAFRAKDYEDRNVVLYGNATTNRAWDDLLADSPVQVSRGRISFGAEVLSQRDQAVLFVRPRADSDRAVVAVVGGTSLAGMRLTNTLPYLYQNFALPDVTVFGTDVLGNPSPLPTRMGYFGSDWSIEKGEWE